MENQRQIAIVKNEILQKLEDGNQIQSRIIYQDLKLTSQSGIKLLREMESRNHIAFGEFISSEGNHLIRITNAGKIFLQRGGYEFEYCKYSVLLFFKEHRDHIFWSNAVEKCDIPQEFSSDLESILEYEDYIKITNQTKSGNIVQGTNKIVAAVYGLEKDLSSVQVTYTDNRIENSGVIIQGSNVTNSKVENKPLQENKINEESEQGKEISRQALRVSKKTLFWTIVAVALALVVWLWPELRKGLSGLL